MEGNEWTTEGKGERLCRVYFVILLLYLAFFRVDGVASWLRWFVDFIIINNNKKER